MEVRLRIVAWLEVGLEVLRENEVRKFLGRKLFKSILAKDRFKALN